jgi:hypothetical protein
MKALYDFLFFCFYCLVIKKPNDQSHIRALMLQGITLTNFLIDFILLFFLMSSYGFNLTMFKIFVLILIFVNVGVNKLENKYYIDNGKYQLSIKKFENRFSKLQKCFLGIFALILILLSTGLFIYIGIRIGKEVNPY